MDSNHRPVASEANALSTELQRRIGAHSRIRTDDLFRTRKVLYQLSYMSDELFTTEITERSNRPEKQIENIP